MQAKFTGFIDWTWRVNDWLAGRFRIRGSLKAGLGGVFLILAVIARILFTLFMFAAFVLSLYSIIATEEQMIDLIWAIPVTLIVWCIIYWIAGFIFELTVMMPLTFLSRLLMGERTEPLPPLPPGA